MLIMIIRFKHSDLQIGEFHGELELDGGQKVSAKNLMNPQLITIGDEDS